ncbi:MAG: hypothetical protein IH947_11770 [Bacteroidetes bacterium]|nr:hypothetical protein [Bacteroidota bacterium]MCH8232810.1 hypothetical protein [Bacteroidota bacterium]
MKKAKIIEAINRLPEDFSIDDLLDEILLIQKIENGINLTINNEVIPDENLDQVLPEWLR